MKQAKILLDLTSTTSTHSDTVDLLTTEKVPCAVVPCVTPRYFTWVEPGGVDQRAERCRRFLLFDGTKWYSTNLELYLCGNRKKCFTFLKYQHSLPLWCRPSYFYFQIISGFECLLWIVVGKHGVIEDANTLKVSTEFLWINVKCFLDAVHDLTQITN